MAKFKIRYESTNALEFADWEIIDAASLEDAEHYAWEAACDDLLCYDGLHGTPCEHEIAEDNPDWTDEEVWEAYCDERESWLSYEAHALEDGETLESINA